jgi:membrane protein DedA with SNARE-associated domain/rhodanese-related sulfurtransferase
MHLIDVMREHGLAVEFLFALASQAGLPVPAEPALVIAGALAVTGSFRPEVAWMTGTVAALIADHVWFAAGRLRGRKLLGLVCRISLSPDTCVRNADSLLHRLGGGVLVLAKLIPGVAAVAIPTAAASGMSYVRFLAYDALGAALWAGLWVGAGVIFGREVDRVLDMMERTGSHLPWVIVTLIAMWVAAKVWQRRRLRGLYRAKRIDAQEVAEWLRTDAPMMILDARSEIAWRDDPRPLPHAERVETPEMAVEIAARADGVTLVSFCTCPNEASAAVIAQRLIDAGFRDVRILAGGTEALDLLAPLA